jgi:hypothetical protein
MSRRELCPAALPFRHLRAIRALDATGGTMKEPPDRTTKKSKAVACLMDLRIQKQDTVIFPRGVWPALPWLFFNSSSG